MAHARFSAIYKYVALICLVLLGPLVMAMPLKAATRYETGIATSTSLLSMENGPLQARLSDLKSLGTTWIRVEFSWAEVQPDNANHYNWGPYDRLVREATRHQLKILAMVAYTPGWAREPRCGALAGGEQAAQRCTPQNDHAFGRFVRAAAIRYKGTNIRGWEIWNEPNINGYWKTVLPDNSLSVDPQKYAALANTAAREIRQNYRDSVIITGGLSPMFEPQYPKGMRQSDYLEQLLPRLKPELFDGIGIHPYCWPVLPDKTAVYNAFYTVDGGHGDINLRSILSKAGWGDKEIWATEFGASTKGVKNVSLPTKTNRPDHVSEATQAQIVKQGIAAWYKKPNVGPLFVHADSDRWLMQHNNEGGFGLRRFDSSKKPAFGAFQEATRTVTDSRPK